MLDNLLWLFGELVSAFLFPPYPGRHEGPVRLGLTDEAEARWRAEATRGLEADAGNTGRRA